MDSTHAHTTPRWTLIAPVLGLFAVLPTWGKDIGVPVALLIAVVLTGAVLAAVHHAEVVAHRVGEPFGSLVLAVAVTVIEVGLIVTLMAGAGESGAGLARDTVFAAVMITVNGVVGLSILVGALKHDLVYFNNEGAAAALTTVLALCTLALVVPTYTSAPGPSFTQAQLLFAAVASLTLYGLFVRTQTSKHRDFFLPVDKRGEPLDDDDHADPPSARDTWISLALLLVALVAVVGLAKVESKPIESALTVLGLPQAFVGVVIALVVLAPETLAAVRNARRGRLQTSINLGLGSAMASVGLTVPTLALLSPWIPGPLHLGLSPLHQVLFAITAIVTALTVMPGRATRLQGGVHLVLLASYIFLAAQP